MDFDFLILPLIEVNENFPRFPSFRFQVKAKIENSETLAIFFFFLVIVTFKVLFPIVFLSWVFASKVYNKKDEKKPKNTETLEISILGMCFCLSEVRECWLLIYSSNLSKPAYFFIQARTTTIADYPGINYLLQTLVCLAKLGLLVLY